MCIIVSKPAGIAIEKDVLKRCFNWNDHGAGFAFSGEDGIVIDKGYFAFEPFYRKLLEHMDDELVIHFRIKSQGNINIKNCHPFHIQSKHYPNFTFAVAHNGTLPWRSTDTMSDTACFVKDVLTPILDRDPWFLDQTMSFMLIERFAGERNKLVIMRHDSEKNENTTYIVNEKAGENEFGCWFSNKSYKPFVNQQKNFQNYGWPGGQYGSQGSEDWSPANAEGNVFFGWTLGVDGEWTPPKKINNPQNTMDRMMGLRYGYNPAIHAIAIQSSKTIPSQTQLALSNEDKDKMSEDEWNKYIEERKAMEEMERIAEEEAARAEADAMLDDKEEHDITVPRDNGVLIDYPPAPAKSAIRLEHLNKKQKRALRRAAADFCRAIASDSRDWSIAQMITHMRTEMRDSFEDATKHLLDTQLDLWIINMYEGGSN